MAKHTGILSDDDRRYLLGLKEYEGEDADRKENQKRYRIRKKLINAINDFDALNMRLSEEDKEMIFEDVDLNGAMAAFRFLYSGVREADDWAHGRELKEAIADVEDRYAPPGVVVDRVDFSLSYTETDPDIDLLRKRLKEGHTLTDSEIGRLVRVGAISPEELEEVKWDREEWDLEELEWDRSSAFHPREN